MINKLPKCAKNVTNFAYAFYRGLPTNIICLFSLKSISYIHLHLLQFPANTFLCNAHSFIIGYVSFLMPYAREALLRQTQSYSPYEVISGHYFPHSHEKLTKVEIRSSWSRFEHCSKSFVWPISHPVVKRCCGRTPPPPLPNAPPFLSKKPSPHTEGYINNVVIDTYLFD